MVRFAVLNWATPIFRRRPPPKRRRRSHGPVLRLIKRHRVFHFNIELQLLDAPELPVPLALDVHRPMSAGLALPTTITHHDVRPLQIHAAINSPIHKPAPMRLDCVDPIRGMAHIRATIRHSHGIPAPLHLVCSDAIGANLAIGATIKDTQELPTQLLLACSDRVAASLAIGATLRDAQHVPANVRIRCLADVDTGIRIAIDASRRLRHQAHIGPQLCVLIDPDELAALLA